jgi:hypothetical protein
MEKVWQNWLSAWAIGVVLFGALLAGGAFDATDGLLRMLLTLFGNPLPETMDAHHRFGFGLMGAVSIGWGLTFGVMFKALALLDGARAAHFWRQLLLAALVWYAVDSYISIATGFWMNAVSNTLLMILLFVPLLKSGAMRDQGKLSAQL